MIDPLFENDGSSPVALAPIQSVIHLFALEVVAGGLRPGPDETLDHTHIGDPSGRTVNLAGHYWDHAALSANVKVGGLMTEPEFAHVFRRFYGDAQFTVAIRRCDSAVQDAETALALPLRKLVIRFISDEYETDVTAIARSAKLSFALVHFDRLSLFELVI